MRRLRRKFRILSLLPTAVWLWKERHVLVGMATFARTVPDRVRLGRWREVLLAARVHWTLLTDPALRGADVRVGAVSGSSVCLEGPSGDQLVDHARRRVLEVPGVDDVRLEGKDGRTVPARPTPAGDGAAAATSAFTGGLSAPTAVPAEPDADAVPSAVGLAGG